MPSLTGFTRPAAPAAARAKHVVAVVAAVCVGGLAAGVGPALAAFPGANGKIAFTSDRDGTNDIWAMSPNGGEQVNLTPASPADDALPNWRADGRKIVFSSDSNALGSNPTPAGFEGPDFELFTMHADGSHVRQITFNDLDDDDPAWSPDGRRIVFQRDVDPLRGPDHFNYDILTMRVSGADERNITNTPARDSAPNWSPDGGRIVFDSERSGGDVIPEIYTMNIDGSRVRRLTDNETFDGRPSWSPNGRKISFESSPREGQLAIYTMRDDGSDQKQLTDEVPDAFGSAWSPNGRIIAHSSFSNPEIFTIDRHGSDVRNLTDDPSAFDFAPDWQPLPKRGH